jgi:hypothetical protein
MAAVAMLVLMTTTTSNALADCDVGDPYKMTVPQLPDPQGWDVKFNYPKVLADDWMCSETGPIADVHFWMSVRHDQITDPAQLKNLLGDLKVSIHDNVPASATNPYSHPGATLRDYILTPDQYVLRPWGSGPQGWYDPNNLTNPYTPNDHQLIWQINIPELPDPYIQEQGKIYWLDLSFFTPTPSLEVGWKSSRFQFDERPPMGQDDDAVFMDIGGPVLNWRPLFYPSGESMNLAFVITPEPSSLAVLALGTFFLLRRSRRPSPLK